MISEPAVVLSKNIPDSNLPVRAHVLAFPITLMGNLSCPPLLCWDQVCGGFENITHT